MVADNDKRIEIVANYMCIAKNFRDEAAFLFKHNEHNSAAAKINHAFYNMLLALGMKCKFEAKNPVRLVNWFNKRFLISKLFENYHQTLLLKTIPQIVENNFNNSHLSEEEVFKSFNELNELISIVENLLFPKAKRGRKPKNCKDELLNFKIQYHKKPVKALVEI